MFYSNTGDANYRNDYTTPINQFPFPYVQQPSRVQQPSEPAVYTYQQPSEPAVYNINDLYVYIKSEFAKIDHRLSKLESNQQQEIDEINKAKEDIKYTVRLWS